MRGESAHRAAVTLLALVRDHRPHQCRFADDAGFRPDARSPQVIQQAAHAEATDFLVVSEGQMQRRTQAAPDVTRNHRQHAGKKALHVGGAAAIEAAVALDHGKGITRPVLAIDRHHVSMAGEHQARLSARAQRREQVGLAACRVVGEADIGIKRAQPLAHKADQFEVGITADSGKGDQPAEQLQRLRGGHGIVFHQQVRS